MLAEGRLPTLAVLRDRGRWIELETPATHFPAGTYASLYSGVRVADHGMYYAFQWSPGSSVCDGARPFRLRAACGIESERPGNGRSSSTRTKRLHRSPLAELRSQAGSSSTS